MGGGLNILLSEVHLTNCTISSNTAGVVDVGGGLILRSGKLHMKSCTISNNTAKSGGGMHVTCFNGLLVEFSTCHVVS